MPNPAQVRPVFLLGGALGGAILSVLPLMPGWPVPVQLHSIIVALAGLPFILFSLATWLYLAAPIILLLANFLGMLPLTSLSWLVTLLAYAAFIVVLHREGVLVCRSMQAESDAAARQVVSLGRERQRLLDVSRIISAIPSLEGSMAHLVRCVATVTRVDQAAIFVLDTVDASQFYLAAIYSPERPVTVTGRYEQRLPLADFGLLQTVITTQSQSQAAPPTDRAALAALFALWFEERTGPASLQPLTVHGRPVGALMLANPISLDPIQSADLTLCRHLAPQIAALVEAYRHFAQPEPSGNHPQPKLVAVNPPEPVSAENSRARAKQPVAVAAAPPGLPVVPTNDVAGHQAIFEVVPEGVVVSDTAGKVRLVNRAAERILGRSRRELVGQAISSVYGEIDSTEPIENLAAAFSRRNEPLPTFSQQKDRWVQGQLIPWRNDNSEWLGIIAIFKDVTHVVKADQARNNFITALSRELRAPLTTIKGYSELILRGVMDDYTPDQLRIQQIMHSSADRMAAVLDNAIQLGAQNKNKIVPHFEQVNIMAVIDEVIEAMTSLAHVHELTLTKEIKTELPPITADRQHITRILENLLENACIYTPPGGYVSVRAWVQHERAGITLRPELVLMVADNGIGIPNAEQRRIFEPFYQIPGVIESGGMGMGLTVVKELVEMHKGRVWVESAVNEGAVFQVALPLTQD